MNEYLKTPILFLIFNRLEQTARVFEQIRDVRPEKLYVASDGPRSYVEKEQEKVKIVREYVLNNIDWNPKIITLFRDKNLGCKYAVSSAITWFFENEEMGIILEDDTLPSQSFFWFCEKLLKMYKDEKKISMIAGTSYLFNEIDIDEVYFFSKYMAIWGWATWKDRWCKYDLNMKNYLDVVKKGIIKSYFNWDSNISEIFESKFQVAYERKIDTWDAQWFYKCVEMDSLCITPYINLVSNIGVEGTRDGRNSPFINMEKGNVVCKFPKKEIIHDLEIDKKLFYNVFYRFDRNTIIKKILKKLHLYNYVKTIYRIFKKNI